MVVALDCVRWFIGWSPSDQTTAAKRLTRDDFTGTMPLWQRRCVRARHFFICDLGIDFSPELL
jgi:hypothetical protein